MITIVSWNIQMGCGVDGKTDLKRIANTIERLVSDADIICLQEVSWITQGKNETNQFNLIHELFPKYKSIEGYGIDRASKEGSFRFGNMVLSRLPVLNIFRHQLPWPAARNVKHMPRQAIEITVDTAFGALRVINTHLEFYSQTHRKTQIKRLRDLHTEVISQIRQPGNFLETGPYAQLSRPFTSVLCGDFNMKFKSKEYQEMLAPFKGASSSFVDAWPALYPCQSHNPTCGVFDQKQWPEGPHCRDFYFVTEDLIPRLSALKVDQKTNASDHQPIALILDDALRRERNA